MGTMTLENFRTDVTEGVLDRTDLSNTNLDRWINFGYLHLSNPSILKHRRLAVSEDEALALNTDAYNLNTKLEGLGASGWELVSVLYAPENRSFIAYLKKIAG